ncbi:MAG: hypothetical protein JW900_01510 [Anaerolineae bacterium]|nr:hypothetical protein [Anaerolineae bacterium]
MSEHAEKIAQQLEKTLDRLSIKSVFGEPLREGETTLIPVAEVSLGFGYGYGAGPAPQAGAAEEEALAEAPVTDEGAIEVELEKKMGGAGSGGGGKARPLGYIRIDPEGVRFESIEDETRIALAGIAMVAWCVFWVAMAIRGRRK